MNNWKRFANKQASKQTMLSLFTPFCYAKLLLALPSLILFMVSVHTHTYTHERTEQDRTNPHRLRWDGKQNSIKLLKCFCLVFTFRPAAAAAASTVVVVVVWIQL